MIVFVTNASSASATLGRGEGVETAARVEDRDGHAARRTGPGDAEPLQAAVDLDDAAVAGAVAAGHRRLPGELGLRREPSHRLEHRLRAAREHVDRLVGQQRRHVGRLDDDLGARDERGRLGVMRRAEAEDRGPVAEHLGDVRETAPRRCRRRRSAGAAPSRSKPLPSGPSTCRRSPAPSPQSVRVPGPIGSIRKHELARPRARQSDIGRGSTCPGGWSMKNWPGTPGSIGPASSAQQRVRPDRLGAGDAQLLLPSRDRLSRTVPIRSCSESAVSARAFAIACTAAAAPEIVVMQGTRATSAASRMR